MQGLIIGHLTAVSGAFLMPAYVVTTVLARTGRVQSVFLLGPLLCSASQRARACPACSPRRRRPLGGIATSVRFFVGARRRAPMDVL